MNKKDYYEILGIQKSASNNDIKAAYKKAALKWHPDRWAQKSKEEQKEAEEQMKLINQAYKVLSDSEKKQNYDKYGDENGFANFNNGFQDFSSSPEFFDEILSSFGFGPQGFGQRKYKSRSNSPIKGSDIRLEIQLTFNEHVFGTKKQLNYNYQKACQTCKQTGSFSSSDIIDCSFCQGTGFVHDSQNTPFGTFRTQVVCPRCQGEKKIIKRKCEACKGKKFVLTNMVKEVNFPKGMKLEQSIKYSGGGNDGLNNGPSGDLYLEIRVKKSELFERKENDVHVYLPISFLDASLGSKVQVITLEGVENIEVPQGTQPGDYLVLKNKGCYVGVNKANRGDLWIWFKIKIPKKVGEKSKKVLEELRENTTWNPNKEFVEKNINLFD